MAHIHDPHDNVFPETTVAALILLAFVFLERLGFSHPAATAVLERLEVSRSRAYALKKRLTSFLSDLVGPTGRPPKESSRPASPELASQVLAYLYEHPGAVSGSAKRHRYSREFRLFVVDLAQDHPDVDRQAFAQSLALPLATLEDWLRGGYEDLSRGDDDGPPERTDTETVKATHIATVVDEFRRWKGSFVAFCTHIKEHLHIPFGRTFIGTILRGHGMRTPNKRPGRQPDESAVRESFETFFPNAQWVGDGSAIPIIINGTTFVCNLELMVDPYSGAYVGANIRLHEDARAVIEAFDDARDSTRTQPISLLLDKKTSNHSPEVVNAVEPTRIIPATPSRPTNKAHVEGGFGLLKSTLGNVTIDASSPAELAQSILSYLVTVWGRTINHRPRADRGGRSRADLLKDKPSQQDIERARTILEQLAKKQERARKTRAARQDPVKRQTVSDALTRLGLQDPKGHFLTALAAYPIDALVDSIAIFEGRQRSGTLPDGVDVRYLLGITRNVSQDYEAWAIMDSLFEERIRARDCQLDHVKTQRDDITARYPKPSDRIAAFIDEALTSHSQPLKHAWLRAAAHTITTIEPSSRRQAYQRAGRRIQASYDTPYRVRQAAVRYLAYKAVPLL